MSVTQQKSSFDPGTLGQRIYFCRTALMLDNLEGLAGPNEGQGLGLRAWYAEGQSPTQAEFGMLLAGTLQRPKAFPAATISRWESDSARPDLRTILNIAKLVGADPGWLAFGVNSGAPSPLDDRPESSRQYLLSLAAFAKMDAAAEARVFQIRRETRERIRELQKAMPAGKKRAKLR